MTNVIIWGAGGRMGQLIATMCRNDEEMRLVAGIDRFANPDDFNFKLYIEPTECRESADVLIDFSRPEALSDILAFCAKRNLPAVLATTGYDEAQRKKIEEHSKQHAVFLSANMSLGINLLALLAKQAAAFLGESFDIEIIEKHHNKKQDAPSGTALLLADAINGEFGGEKEFVCGRKGKTAARSKKDIGIHAVRGGTIVGQHEILFAGHNEVITLSHEAESKEVFAKGAIAAAKFMTAKKSGLYDMSDLLSSKR